MRDRYFKNEDIELWLERDIVFAVVTTKELTLDKAKLMVEERLKVTEGKCYPTFADYTACLSATKEARMFMANEGSKGVTAGAMIVRNQIQKLVGNLFMTINWSKIPARLFTNKDDALKWLQHYRNLN